MHWNNNATRIRRDLLMRLVRLLDQGRLEEEIDRIPYDMTPRDEASVRCCVHHDRAILKLRLLARMGLRIEDQKPEEEHLPLAIHARRALARNRIEEPVLTVIDEACHACVQSRIFVSNACQGCMARPCMVNCPKKCIAMKDGKALINDEACVNCGICVQACSYGAILKIPVPCEEACPVGAITKGDDGKETINFDRCISCGACMAACPFGAVTDRSQILDVVKALKDDSRPVTAMVAPAVMAQFRADTPAILAALRALGFAQVWEVAAGAHETARTEAAELGHLLDHQGPTLATSCCPAWVEAAVKHLRIPIAGDHQAGAASVAGAAILSGSVASPTAAEPPSPVMILSSTASPMVMTAGLVRQAWTSGLAGSTGIKGSAHPGSAPLLVFIGPCVAKRMEALRSGSVDFVLSSEELGAFMMARGIELSDHAQSTYPAGQSVPGSLDRGFAASGGVARAVLSHLAPGQAAGVKVRRIDGLDKAVIKDLVKNGPGSGTAGGETEGSPGPCQLLEGMACKGGCIHGPSILVNPKIAQGQLRKQVWREGGPGRSPGEGIA